MNYDMMGSKIIHLSWAKNFWINIYAGQSAPEDQALELGQTIRCHKT